MAEITARDVAALRKVLHEHTMFMLAVQHGIPTHEDSPLCIEYAQDKLIDSAQALLDLDAKGALSPHGIGGLARENIEKFIAAHRAHQKVTDEMVKTAWDKLIEICPMNLIEPDTLRPVLEAALQNKT